MKNSPRLYIRPKDSSYESFASTIKAMCEHLGVPFAEDQDLRDGYKRYLAKTGNQEPAETSVKRTAPKRVTRLKKKS